MADGTVSLEFMENYARVKERLYGKPKQPVVHIERKKEEEKKQPAEVIPIGPFQQALNELKEDERRMNHPYLKDLKGMKAREILYPILLEHKMNYNELRGVSREKKYHIPRRQCFAALRDAGWSTPRIGKLFNRDHSTIVHGLQMWEKHLEHQRNSGPA
jgi:hypothetical protein